MDGNVLLGILYVLGFIGLLAFFIRQKVGLFLNVMGLGFWTEMFTWLALVANGYIK